MEQTHFTMEQPTLQWNNSLCNGTTHFTIEQPTPHFIMEQPIPHFYNETVNPLYNVSS